MRNLNTADLFAAARAVKSSGLRDKLKEVALKLAHEKVDVESVGVDTILTVIECFADKGAEQAVYQVLSGPFEIPASQIESMELSELLDNIEQLSKDPGLSDFFKRLSGVIGSN